MMEKLDQLRDNISDIRAEVGLGMILEKTTSSNSVGIDSIPVRESERDPRRFRDSCYLTDSRSIQDVVT